MKKTKLSFNSIAIIFMFIMLIFICYKIVIYENEITGLHERLNLVISLLEKDGGDMPYEIQTDAVSPVPDESEAPERTIYKVYISGQVISPGVYDIEEGSRVSDLIVLAGGPGEEADLDNINMAAYVEDGRHVKIPSKGEEITEDIEVFMAGGEGDAPAESAEYSKPEYTGPVNINTADRDTLMSLPGVGQATAQNIIDYRNQNGEFKSIDDIKNVYRIGDSIFNNIAGMIVVK